MTMLLYFIAFLTIRMGASLGEREYFDNFIIGIDNITIGFDFEPEYDYPPYGEVLYAEQILQHGESIATLRSGTVYYREANAGVFDTKFYEATKMVKADKSFAVLSDDKVVAWNSSSTFPFQFQLVENGVAFSVANQLQEDVVDLYSNDQLFVAIKKDKSVVVFGNHEFTFSLEEWKKFPNGGNNEIIGFVSNVEGFTFLFKDATTFSLYNGQTEPYILDKVVRIVASKHAFAALLSDGTVETWGSEFHGGSQSLYVNGGKDKWEDEASLLPPNNTQSLHASKNSICALGEESKLVCWGTTSYSKPIADVLPSTGIKEIYSTSDIESFVIEMQNNYFFFLYPNNNVLGEYFSEHETEVLVSAGQIVVKDPTSNYFFPADITVNFESQISSKGDMISIHYHSATFDTCFYCDVASTGSLVVNCVVGLLILLGLVRLFVDNKLTDMIGNEPQATAVSEDIESIPVAIIQDESIKNEVKG